MTDVLVLCYHAVSPTWTADLSVTPEALEWQLSRLVTAGWHGTTFADAVLEPPADRTLVVTFDDGFASVQSFGLPVLDKLGLPATVFVPSAFMGTRQRLRWPGIEHWSDTPYAEELRGMDWSDLRELADLGWEIGSHTCSHPRLTELTSGELEKELCSSRREVSENVGRPCRTIAYPYGAADARVASCAEAAGYAAGASLGSSLRHLGAHRWPRVGVYHGDDERRFRVKISGLTRRLRASRLYPSHE
jgi:peptidoglycan/xylan/chitin deacetylase (PgdA/CDA1 family)